jgi:tripartite-type tricarboxylate transporter receptor subunit TctC
MSKRMQLTVAARLAAVFVFGFSAATATAATPAKSDYPSKPIRILVGFEPGGGSDTLTRLITPKLTEILGQALVIDNRPGANGVISMELTARASPDGYTLLNLSASSVVSAALLTRVSFDTTRAFAPVSMLTRYPYVLLVSQSMPANVKDLIAYAKNKPGALSYGSSGFGSAAHLGMELLKQTAGLDMVHVPYKGVGPAITDLIGGRIQLLFGSTVSSAAAVKTAKVRAIAVTSARRAKALPDLPTIAESGVPKFDLTGWYGLVGPAGVPQPVVAKLNQAVAHVMSLPDVQSALNRDGSEPAPSTPGELAQTVVREVRTWKKVMQQSNLKLE